MKIEIHVFANVFEETCSSIFKDNYLKHLCFASLLSETESELLQF